MSELDISFSKGQKRIAVQVLIAFAIAILVGSFLLHLPQMTSREGGMDYIDALFTATSSICVTGLIVQDTPTYFSTLGKALILVMIQIGGLGIMTVTSIFGLMLGRQIYLKDKYYLSSTFGSKRTFSPARFILLVALTTFAIELIGMVLLSGRFYFHYDYPLKASLYLGLFHSISAFNNAGFALFSNSMETFVADVPINLIMMVLIIIGGIGYPVFSELITRRRRNKFSLHAKIIFVTTIFLILLGSIMFFLMEFNNMDSIGSYSLGNKVMASFFQSVTSRTAGFNTVNTGGLTQATLFFTTILMFIGASPGSTGGGIKTTTFAAITLGALSALKGRKNVLIFKKRIPDSIITRSLAITLTGILLVVVATLGVMLFEKSSALDALFEVVSAFGTVGLSTGITMSLTTGSKIILILVMFIGRIGISVLGLVLAFGARVEKVSRPEESINI